MVGIVDITSPQVSLDIREFWDGRRVEVRTAGNFQYNVYDPKTARSHVFHRDFVRVITSGPCAACDADAQMDDYLCDQCRKGIEV
jgi:hypothetical protein